MKKLSILLSSAILLVFSTNAQSDIRKVDLKNFTYEVQIFEKKEKLKVKNGSYYENSEDDKLIFSAEVDGYGDLGGNEIEKSKSV